MGRIGFYRGDVTINLSSVDPIVNSDPSRTSGVLRTRYSLDGGADESYSTSSPIIISAEGQHTITYFSTDRAGNNEQEQTVSFVIDKTAPEFVIEFNPSIKDLQFTGTDNISSSSDINILDQDSLITLTDQAGNISQITLKDKDRKNKLKTEIKTLSYNNQPQDISKTKASFDWQFDKEGILKQLEQQIKSKKDFNIAADYQNNITELEGKDQTGKISKSITGMVLLKITTSQGDFSWTY